MATLWAAVFLGESLTWPQIVGGALVIVGVVALLKISARVLVPACGGRLCDGGRGV